VLIVLPTVAAVAPSIQTIQKRINSVLVLLENSFDFTDLLKDLGNH